VVEEHDHVRIPDMRINILGSVSYMVILVCSKYLIHARHWTFHRLLAVSISPLAVKL